MYNSPLDIVMSCFVFFAFVAFCVCHLLLASKRLHAWFIRMQQRNHPSSVEMTLNQMNVTLEDFDYMKARHAGHR